MDDKSFNNYLNNGATDNNNGPRSDTDNQLFNISNNLPSMLFAIQEEWNKVNNERLQWYMEKAEFKAQIAHLNGEMKGQEGVRVDLIRRIKMLEFSVRQERLKCRKYQKLLEMNSISPKDIEGLTLEDEKTDVELNNIVEEDDECRSLVERLKGRILKDSVRSEEANRKWQESRSRLREYLNEIQLSDNLLDLRQLRLKTFLNSSKVEAAALTAVQASHIVQSFADQKKINTNNGNSSSSATNSSSSISSGSEDSHFVISNKVNQPDNVTIGPESYCASAKDVFIDGVNMSGDAFHIPDCKIISSVSPISSSVVSTVAEIEDANEVVTGDKGSLSIRFLSDINYNDNVNETTLLGLTSIEEIYERPFDDLLVVEPHSEYPKPIHIDNVCDKEFKSLSFYEKQKVLARGQRTESRRAKEDSSSRRRKKIYPKRVTFERAIPLKDDEKAAVKTSPTDGDVDEEPSFMKSFDFSMRKEESSTNRDVACSSTDKTNHRHFTITKTDDDNPAAAMVNFDFLLSRVYESQDPVNNAPLQKTSFLDRPPHHISGSPAGENGEDSSVFQNISGDGKISRSQGKKKSLIQMLDQINNEVAAGSEEAVETKEHKKKANPALELQQFDQEHLGELANINIANEFDAEEIDNVSSSEIRTALGHSDDVVISEGFAESASMSKAPFTWMFRAALRGHLDAVRCVAFCPSLASINLPATEPLLLVSCGDDSTLKFWNVGKTLAPKKAEQNVKTTGDEANTDVNDCILTLYNHKSSIISLTWTMLSPTFTSSSTMKTLLEERGFLNSVIFSADIDGHIIASFLSLSSLPDDDNLVDNFVHTTQTRSDSVPSHRCITLGEGHNDAVWSLKVFDNLTTQEQQLVSMSCDGQLCFWSIANAVNAFLNTASTAKPIASINIFGPENSSSVPTVSSCCFEIITSSQEIAIGCSDGQVIIFNVTTMKNTDFVINCRTEIDESEPLRTTVMCLKYTENNKRSSLLVGLENGSIAFIDVETKEIITQMTAHLDSISSLSFDAESLYFATGSHDDSIRIWQFSNNTCIQDIQAHRPKNKESVVCVAFHETLPILVSSGADGIIKLFSPQQK